MPASERGQRPVAATPRSIASPTASSGAATTSPTTGTTRATSAVTRNGSAGAFTRTLRLSYAVEADQVRATFENGVLTVTLPKPAELQRRAKRIEVKTAA